MAYNGYLIKVGNYEIPTNKYIRAESYSITRNIQDLNSYRNEEGVLIRTALDHVPLKIEFETPPMLTNIEMSNLFLNFQVNYISEKERKAEVTAYVPELDKYISQEMYMADPQFTIYGNYGHIIRYQSVRIAFIGY